MVGTSKANETKVAFSSLMNNADTHAPYLEHHAPNGGQNETKVSLHFRMRWYGIVGGWKEDAVSPPPPAAT